MNNSRPSFALNSNKGVGFKTAVTNGQTRLALEYAEQLISDLCDRVKLLEDSSITEESTVPPKATTEVDLVEEKPKVVRAKKAAEEI
jgi:hypothetical protein